ncbi:uncharacterized protein B0P05DRAFT_116317 [Gilbertella persicaria]|uniref:uncharacterized protein n=1 Tax=Gilbertella persicaria TaxID=101096 RepID=UPI002220578F|nr:uncharacterized protein B0P05DRAFT_116317 [Gilbertella persicaria]KAI8078296.1 hypothetical protein B0P05DRAFT_116317 [Gilbertella persicaria]
MRCLSPKKIVAGNLKSIITLLYITMLFMQMSYDIASTWIKYQEKFMVEPGTLSIISTPFVAWDSKHQDIAEAFDYIECINLSMQTSVFFLLQCFWNYLSNSVAKKSFMSSREFKFYIFWYCRNCYTTHIYLVILGLSVVQPFFLFCNGIIEKTFS